MAPSATETITVTQPPLKLHSTKSGTGDYKQLQAHNVDRDAEEGRKEGIKAAKVRRPTNHTRLLLCVRMLLSARLEQRRIRVTRSISLALTDRAPPTGNSMPTTFPRGTLARNIPP